MPPRLVRARDGLAAQKIRSPEDVVTWSRKRGLLGVYLLYSPARDGLPACWQVIRPGRSTNPNGPSWQRGNRTFLVHSGPDKARAEEAARTWATVQYACTTWVRIEGLGGALFPEAVAEELLRYVPDLVTYTHRQHTEPKLRSRN